MDSRSNKIEMLVRKNRGTKTMPSLLAGLAEVLDKPVPEESIVPLHETDVLFETLRAGYHTVLAGGALSCRKTFTRFDEEIVFGLIKCFGASLPGNTGFLLLTQFSKDCGAVSVEISALLEHVGDVLHFDRDSLSLLSSDRRQGLLLDWNPDDREETFEVAVWGEFWPLSILACADLKYEMSCDAPVSGIMRTPA